MRALVTRTITGIAYLLVLGFAFFVTKWLLVVVFTAFLIIAIYEYINLAQKFPAPKNTSQRIIRYQILPLVWMVIPVLLIEYWCVCLNAVNIMVALFIILCMNDTMAYVVGSLFGKHKLWPKVSPKKSWEGFFGGLICTMAACWFLIEIPYFQNDIFTNPYIWMGFAFVVIIAGIFGDFAESMVKRFANQKDSGAILPGHGGVLDRIDSMLFAVPAGFIYWCAVRGVW
jgi:phosphatidate cytidylyltransferase